jgi:hypothetical protein
MADDKVTEDKPFPKLQAAVDIVKGLTWPVVIVFVIIFFFGPVSKIAHLLPDKLRDANKISAGGLSLEIQRAASQAGNPRLAERIGGLSENALRFLLNASSGRRGLIGTGTSGSGERRFYLPSSSEMAAIEELASKQLFECDMPLPEWRRNVMTYLEPVQAGNSAAYRLKPEHRAAFTGNDTPGNVSCGATAAGTSAVDLVIDAVSRQLPRDSSEAQNGASAAE